MAIDVFISYPHQDKSTADAVCNALESAGIRCWIAPRDVDPGAEWAASIVGAISRCRAMILIFSSSANESKQIYREVQQAFDRDKPVVPFRIENVSPQESLAYYMGPVHWLDALTPPLERHLAHLVTSVAALLQKNTAPTAEFSEPNGQRDRPAPPKHSTTPRSPKNIERRALIAAGAATLGISGAVAFFAYRYRQSDASTDAAISANPQPKPDSGPSIDAFIAYASKDKTLADTACSILEAAGMSCWIAPRDIKPGIEYAASIEEGIGSCRAMVLIFSSNANASTQIYKEIELALDKNLSIVAVRADATKPSNAISYYMGSAHWIDARTPPLAQHPQLLVEAVRSIIGQSSPSGKP